MDSHILKKRLNTFKTSTGRIQNVSDDVILEVLRAWESWPGKSSEFYRDLGLSKQQLATFLKKGKKLIKNGVVESSEFKELNFPVSPSTPPCPSSLSMRWSKGKVIRFPDVDHLVDFLKKVS